VIEGTFLFLAAYLLTWQALVIVLLLGIAFEHAGNRKSAVFTGLVAMAISYFYFDIPFSTIWGYVVAYFAVGVVWSFLRYRRYVGVMVKSLEKRTWRTQEDKDKAINNLAPSNNLERITSWIIVWPFSVIENSLGDIITAIQSLVTRVFKGIYYKIFMAQTEALRNREEPVEAWTGTGAGNKQLE
jgi:hypothetical protein